MLCPKKFLLSLLLSLATGFWVPSLQAANTEQCPAKIGELNEQDMEIARVAWKYFENNFQKSTGLVNAAHAYPSTTLWDTGSALAAFISAEAIGLISRERFDKMTEQMLETLLYLDLFNDEAPNKAYHTKTAAKVNYANKPSKDGIGVSTLDLGRIASWLNILSCRHPHHREMAAKVLESWSMCRLLEHGQMYGMGSMKDGKAELLQEGRLGYEQYAGKAFAMLGFDQSLSATYYNMYSTTAEVEGVEIRVDARDASTLGAHNYVVAESYAMDYFEHGGDDENIPLIEAIYEAQKRRWERTGILTAVSEDNLDRKPYFVYNTLFTNDEVWKALTDKGEDMEEMKTLSTKASISMAYLFPEREYSKLLLEAAMEARNPKGGWYSGIYEDKAKGFNKATTANTNGVILSIMLNKLYGPLNQVCEQCGKTLQLDKDFMALHSDKKRCLAELPNILAKNKARTEEALAKAAKQKAESKPKNQAKSGGDVGKVWSVFGKVKHAEKLKNEGKLTEAAGTLKGLKKTIWQLGDQFPAEQKTFRGLMGSVDSVVGQWNVGKSSAGTQNIQKVLKAAATRLQK